MSDYSQSTSNYPYQKYNQFNLEMFDDVECVTEFRFAESDIPRLSEALQLPHKIVCCQETVANNIEVLCILLKSRLSDMVKFLEETLQKSVIFNYILDYINSRFSHFLSSWNQDILQPNELALYYKVIHLQEASPQQNCFEFVDGTVLRISCPKINQKLFFR